MTDETRTAVRSRYRAPRGGTEAGTTAIEFAIVATLFFAFLLGSLDFGINYNNWEGLRFGIRAGGRAGIVNQAGTNTTGCASTPALASLPNTTPAGATLATAAEQGLLCEIKRQLGLKQTNARVWFCFPGSDGICSGATSSDDRAQIGDVLRVCAMYPTDSVTGATRGLMPSRLSDEIELRLEQKFPSVGSVQETAIRGDWSFCA